jgi:alkylation response protein AidB-like acyl-CoA dehydrogenase
MTTMSVPKGTVDESVVGSARSVGSVVAEHADATERDRRLARPVVEALRAAGLFRLFTPRALGGKETDPVTFARAVEEVSSFDSAAGWAFQAGGTGAWWTSRMSPEGVAELYNNGPDVLMSASFSPPHRAVEVSDGYRVTGRGPLASTIHDSQWVMVSAIVFDGDQPRMTPFGPEVVAVVLRTSDVEIIKTWDSLGMRGTDSNDIAANGVLVPRSRAFLLRPDHVASAPFDGPLYRMPALAATFTIIVPVALAIARGAIGELRHVVESKVPLGSQKTARTRGAVQAAVAEAEATMRSARLYFYDALAAAWERAVAHEAFTLEHKADLMLASTWAVHSAARATDLMHRMGGTAGVYTRSRLERHFRRADRASPWQLFPTAGWKRLDRCISASSQSSRSWRSEVGASVSTVPFARADGQAVQFVAEPLHASFRATCRANGFLRAIALELDLSADGASLVSSRAVKILNSDFVPALATFEPKKGALRSPPLAKPLVRRRLGTRNAGTRSLD